MLCALVTFAQSVLIFLSQSRVIKQTVSFALMKSSYIFSKHQLIRTMDTFLSRETQTVIYCQPHFIDSTCALSVYFPCNNHVLIQNIEHWLLRFYCL